MIFAIKAGVPLAAGIAVILLFEGPASTALRIAFGTLCFAVGYAVAWVHSNEG